MKPPSIGDVLLGVFFGVPNAPSQKRPSLVRTSHSAVAPKPCACDGKRR